MNVNILLSGHICRLERGGLKPFWTGFINLQKALPINTNIKQIYGHSWSTEYLPLVEMVYGPGTYKCEAQPELKHLISDPDYFERGFNRSKSTWKNVSIQSVLGNMLGRVSVIDMLGSNIKKEEICILTRWDIGCSGSQDVHTINFDDALDMGYIYSPYFREIDEGYADMWFYSNVSNIKLFKDSFGYAVQSLNGENDYLNCFTQSWPSSVKSSFFSDIIRRFSYNKLLDRRFSSVRISRLKFAWLRYIMRWVKELLYKYERQVEIWPNNIKNRCYPTFQSLNIHALLKKYCIEFNIREKMIFLRNNDFCDKEKKGSVINALNVVYTTPNNKLNEPNLYECEICRQGGGNS